MALLKRLDKYAIAHYFSRSDYIRLAVIEKMSREGPLSNGQTMFDNLVNEEYDDLSEEDKMPYDL